MTSPAFRVGVDVGGTFTDLAALGQDGGVHTRKVSSSVDDYARAILDGLRDLCRDAGLSPAAVAELLHGTTVASNAILERRGARTGLVTTRGFRDVLVEARHPEAADLDLACRRTPSPPRQPRPVTRGWTGGLR